MATYAIGDVQGCLEALLQLLDQIHYQPERDQLWFTGDLINRGPTSLETLRFLSQLNPQPVTVLGNHDLHLLAVYFHREWLSEKDTFTDILNAPDCDQLCKWLLKQPLMVHDEQLKFSLVHAGIAPFWDVPQALVIAREVEIVLQSDQASACLAQMHGDEPDCWREELTGFDRLRVAVNYFTRMRYCTAEGALILDNKTDQSRSALEIPWFNLAWRRTRDARLLIGHWASLMGQCVDPNVFALDTGCVWGNALTALRLEDLKYFSVRCKDTRLNPSSE